MSCPLCETEGAVLETEDNSVLVSCLKCSDFSISHSALAQWRHSKCATHDGMLQLAWRHLARERSQGQLPAIRLEHVWGWAVPSSAAPARRIAVIGPE